MSDTDYGSFFDWLAKETQSYVEAAQRNDVRSWLLNRGYSESYLSLELGHGAVLHDHFHTRYRQLQRDVYQCTNCKRVHIQSSKSDEFACYAAERGDAETLFVEDECDHR